MKNLIVIAIGVIVYVVLSIIITPFLGYNLVQTPIIEPSKVLY